MEAIEGTVVNTIYRSANGYTVLEIDGKVPTTVVGNLPDIRAGEYVRFFGEFKEHRVYGKQFSAVSCESSLPADVNDIALFLSGGFIKGLGEVLAGRITEAFGDDTFDVIENNPEMLASVKGVSQRLAIAIHEALGDYTGSRDSYARLMGMGLTAKQAVKVFNAFGPGAASAIKNNPYLLIQRVKGIDFLTADRIAANIGFPEDHPARIEGGLLHVLRKSLEKGHTNVPAGMLVNTVVNRLGVDAGAAECALDELSLRGAVVRRDYGEGDRAFLGYVYEAEHSSAVKIIKMLGSRGPKEIRGLERKLEKKKKKYSLSDEQTDAVRTACLSGISIITGGPGTGKTTILRALAEILAESGETFALCAPTGRAAKRMQEACGADASTVHRLLEYSRASDEDDTLCIFGRNSEHPLDCGTLILDEASMLDVFIFAGLTDALPEDSRLVIVGDVNQLPSVGPGTVMEDLIASDLLPVVRLSHVYRHDGGIADAAQSVLEGQMPEFTDDFSFTESEDDAGIADIAVSEYMKCLGAGFETQMLSPVKAGVTGSKELDVRLRDMVNPAEPGKEEAEIGDTLYRLGDRVMQIKNNYDREWYTDDEYGEGVFNGDIGEIVRAAAGSIHVDFEGKVTVYEAQDLSELSGAYAYTVHKSQGNEFDVVILPLRFPKSPFFSRNLLYTAITRAKKRAVLIGSKATLKHMIDNAQRDSRYTALLSELKLYSDVFSGSRSYI